LNSVAINKNGDTASIAYANYQTTNMDDGNWRDAQVSYDSGTKKVSLYIDSNFAVMADLDLGMDSRSRLPSHLAVVSTSGCVCNVVSCVRLPTDSHSCSISPHSATLGFQTGGFAYVGFTASTGDWYYAEQYVKDFQWLAGSFRYPARSP